jgi:hypothetical protein
MGDKRIMGSHMIWDVTFKDKESKKKFLEFMKKKNIRTKLIHDHYDKEYSFNIANFYYDVGYLGYAEAEELSKKLIKLGVTDLNQIRLCDIDGDKIIKNSKEIK